MTYPRSQLVCLADTPYYHIVSRCVRRAFLCGLDPLSGKSFDHRKVWVVERLDVLSAMFAVELLAYAVMSNHTHLVVKIDSARSAAWSDREVVERWRRLFRLPPLVEYWLRDSRSLSEAEVAEVKLRISQWRERLGNLSWYMRCLNEFVARKANREDGCTGRFWEGRFHSQALLDEKALLTCMAYVDLNPIRAGIARTPEGSDFTSIQQRIERSQRPSLLALRGDANPVTTASGLAITWPDYLALVDWTGRALREDKRGAVSPDVPEILVRLQIPDHAWLDAMHRYPRRFHRAFGAVDRLKALRDRLHQRWLWGIRGAPIYQPPQPA